MRTTTKRLTVAALAASAIALPAVIAQPAPAEAASTGYVYLAYPTWAGNCPNGGSVTVLYGAVDNLWSTPPTGDIGDDLVYAKVRIGANSTVSMQPRCNRSWAKGGPYMGVPSQHVIKATRSGQTFWLGPVGKWNN